MSLPLNKNDDIVLEISAMGSEGQGIGRYEGLAVFVNGAIVGEKVNVHIIKVNKTYAVGKLVEVIEASEDRRVPKCEIFNKCGGCSLQHMNYEAQLEFKRQRVEDAIRRIGGIDYIDVLPTIGMFDAYHYRNKGSFPFANVDGKTEMGFFAAKSHRLIPVNDCIIQNESIMNVVKTVREWAKKYSISAYDEINHRGVLRHAVARISSYSKIVLVIVTTGALPHKQELLDMVNASCKDVIGIIHNINKEKTNVILGNKYIKLWGEEKLKENICGIEFEVSPSSFLQVNHEQTEKLYNKAIDFLEPRLEDKIADIYCGIGTISLLVAKKVKSVIGIEYVSDAVENAKNNARLNNIKNAEFICGEAEKVLPELVNSGLDVDGVILDPPRKGCDKALIDALLKCKPKKIVYVSCDASTLARDLKILCESKYRLEKVQPVDMFMQTHSIETVVRLTLNNMYE